MITPLLWKELRESRIAIGIGIAWVLGPINFWLWWAGATVPWPAEILLAPTIMVAPAACMIALGVARFASERHRGTWEFLRAHPVPLRRAVAVKWWVALGLTALFSGVSSALAWYPATQLEKHLNHMTLAHWTCFHVAASSLFVALLLLLDTLDWGDRLALRAVATFGILVPFVWATKQEFNGHWFYTLLYAALALGCGLVSVAAAPTLARESLLPPWSFRRSSRQRTMGPVHAWLWLQWRQVWFVVLLLLVPIPLLLVVMVLPGLLSAGSASEQHNVLEDMIPLVGKVIPGLLCIAAGLLGWIVPVLDTHGNADSFNWALPMPRRKIQFLRVGFVLGLLLLIHLPALALGVAQIVWFGQGSFHQLALDLALQFCGSAAIALFILLVSALGIGAARFLLPLLAPFALGVAIVYANRVLYTSGATPATVAPIALTILAASLALLPVIDRRREV